MIKNYKISVVMPCRNEAKGIKEFIKNIPKEYDEIILVSNKSTDDTEKIAKQIERKNKRFHLVIDNRSRNGIGYGYAHMSGIDIATGDIIVGADADGTYPIEEIAKIIQYMDTSKKDFIVCERYPVMADSKGIGFKQKLGIGLLNLEIMSLFGIKLNDSLSGMWVFRKDVRDKLKLSDDMGDWNLSPGIKINAALYLRDKFGRYHIKQHMRLGETKQDYFKTGFRHAKWILKHRLNPNK